MCALSLGLILVVARDALWRGPVVAPRATVDWLLMQPIRPGRVLRPWFWVSCCIALVPGVVAAGAAAVALGLMEKVPFASALAGRWSAASACRCWPPPPPCWWNAPPRSPGGSAGPPRWWRCWCCCSPCRACRRARTPLAAAGAGRDVVGTVGWAALAGLSPTHGAQPGGWAAALALVLLTVLALLWAHRATAGIPLGSLRLRARTAAGVAAALRTAELRSARLVLAQADQKGRKVRLRIPPPQRAALIVPWRDLTALLRAPSRFGRAVLFSTPALLLAVPAAHARGADRVLLTALAVALGYLGVAQLAEPARVEADDPRRAGWSPYPYAKLMLRHAAVPAVASVLLLALGAGVATAVGAGAAVWLAPVAALPLTAAAMVNACRGPSRQELMYTPRGAGSMGPFIFLAWYAAGPLTTVPALAFALDSRPVSSVLWCLLITAVLMYWSYQRALTLSGRHRPKD
ncbi:hypothetical protein GXW82_39620 [Streptacidiphilus sp. 4-A2]|nr:hypothetical protein [Streptacidiphilus sp. 4-A2]